MHYVESALVVKWSFETQNPTSSAGSQVSTSKCKNRSEFAITTQTHGGNFRERFRFGYVVLSSVRNVGTPYVVKGTPEFSTKDRDYIPSRREFLIRKAIIITLALFAIKIVSQTKQPYEYNQIVFSVEAVPIFKGDRENLRIDKLIFRSVTVLIYRLVLYLVLNGFLSLFPFINVALGVEDVRVYRPNFGPIHEAYSLRQFWG